MSAPPSEEAGRSAMRPTLNRRPRGGRGPAQLFTTTDLMYGKLDSWTVRSVFFWLSWSPYLKN